MWRPEKRAIAFLDVMGFTKLIEQAERDHLAYQKFQSLKHVIESHVRWDNSRLAKSVPDEVKPRYVFISDSIILSVPLDFGGYDGLSIVAIKCVEIAHKVLELGFLLRGGITIGNVWHEINNVFGTGYMEAYKLEESVKPPRIVLSDAAKKHLDTATHPIVPPIELGPWLHAKKYSYLDTFHPSYIRDIHVHGRIEGAFQRYRIYISNTLGELSDRIAQTHDVKKKKSSGRILKKWDSIRVQFNRALKQHSVNLTPIPKP